MKNLLASIFFVFLFIFPSAYSQDSFHVQLYSYLVTKIVPLNNIVDEYDVDDISFEAGYNCGKREAYGDILEQLTIVDKIYFFDLKKLPKIPD